VRFSSLIKKIHARGEREREREQGATNTDAVKSAKVPNWNSFSREEIRLPMSNIHSKVNPP